MDKIKWRIKQKNGIELVEPSDNLCNEYFDKSENALKAVRSLEGNNEWQISSAYYSMYFSLYALMMKAGIKCEIHSCTIELMRLMDFPTEEINLLKSSLDARIDAQYYTDREVAEEKRKRMVEKAPEFHLKCRDKAAKMTQSEIKHIRDSIKNASN